jgi:glycerol-3-phosphate dehydrogenase (NAD(P)+)
LASNAGSKKIAVYGAGAWGTALAIRWAAHHDVTLIARRAEHLAAMQSARENVRYLPGSLFPKTLKTAPQVLPGTQWIVLGVPTSGLVDALTTLQAHKALPLIALCKGFIGEAARLPAAQIGQLWEGSHAVLSGPSFAQEVARGLPTAVTLASSDAAFAAEAAGALADEALRIYPTTDVIGVEIGGAVKNVLAIAAGLCDGLQLGANARAALLTRGLAEATRLAVALGGEAHTLAGLAGMGDLVLTATGDLSRNRRVGLGLAAGQTLGDIVAGLGHVAEGIPAAQNVLILAKNAEIEMPICSAVAQLLAGKMNAHEAVAALMRRATPGL